MVDWLSLGFNALWVAGSVLVLAVLSTSNWIARASGQRLRDQLAQPRQKVILALAGQLFCVGMLGTSTILWERIVWDLLVLAFTVLLVQAVRSVRKGIQSS